MSREDTNKTIRRVEYYPDDRKLVLPAFKVGLHWLVLNEAPPAHV